MEVKVLMIQKLRGSKGNKLEHHVCVSTTMIGVEIAMGGGKTETQFLIPCEKGRIMLLAGTFSLRNPRGDYYFGPLSQGVLIIIHGKGRAGTELRSRV